MAGKKKGKSKKREARKGAVRGVKTGLRILSLVLLLVLLIFLGRNAYQIGYGVFNETSMETEPGREVTVTITSGMSPYSIGKLLRRSGLIDNEYTFVLQERLSPYHGELEAGTYIFNTTMTPSDMMAVMAKS